MIASTSKIFSNILEIVTTGGTNPVRSGIIPTVQRRFKRTMKEKLRKSIIEMLLRINDTKKLERIHQFVEYIYTKE
ncbi:hypothetical protein [Bacteroides sp.]|uniref:hypothetical protein n=1 Tax=Bacteroides sp. TaxID=29523 RepID=UPI002633963C|nr:hypothetical protein [Bacteroides sp.]MDD3040528.1 hypothetical protein [Bacteroides sp.]